MSNSLPFIQFSLKLLFGMCYVILLVGNTLKVCISCQCASLNHLNPLSSAWKMKFWACWAVLVPAFIQTSKQIGFCSVAVSGFLREAFLLGVEQLEWTPWQHIQNLLPFYLKRNRRMDTEAYFTWGKSNLLKLSFSPLSLSLCIQPWLRNHTSFLIWCNHGLGFWGDFC